MVSQRGVAESGRHLPWATAICNHDQSSDPSAACLLVSLLQALLFWVCSSPVGEPCRRLRGRHVGVAGTVRDGDSDTSWHQAWQWRLQNLLICEKRSTSSPDLLTDYYLSLVTGSNFPPPACGFNSVSPDMFSCLHLDSSSPLCCSLCSPSLSSLTFFCLFSSKFTKWLILRVSLAIKEPASHPSQTYHPLTSSCTSGLCDNCHIVRPWAWEVTPNQGQCAACRAGLWFMCTARYISSGKQQ